MSGKKKLVVDIPAEVFDRWDEVVKAEKLTRTDAICESMIAHYVSYVFRQNNKDFVTRAKEFMDEQVAQSQKSIAKPAASKRGPVIENPIARTPRTAKGGKLRRGVY